MAATDTARLAYATPEQLVEVLYHRWDLQDLERWLARSAAGSDRPPVITEAIFKDCKAFRVVPNEPLRKEYRLVEGDLDEHLNKSQAILLERILVELTDATNPPLPVVQRTRPGTWIREQLGLKTRRQGVLPWLMDYNVAVAVTKALGLNPVYMGV